MIRQRQVEPEWLDTLAADDPRAARSRDDLRRINRLMGTQTLLTRSLETLLEGSGIDGSGQARLVELGAGDGTLALRLARRLSRRWPKATLRLLDLQPTVSDATLVGFRALGWQVEVIRADVFDWLAQPRAFAGHADESKAKPIIFANLFIHHFEGPRLKTLLTGIADRAQGFSCLEPRRSLAALLGSRLLGAIGCNDVTRHDAVTSVRAGFRARELSGGWPRSNRWDVQEGAAGLFSHRFQASRIQAPDNQP